MTCEMGILNDEDLVISCMRSRAVVLKLHYMYPLVYLIDFGGGGVLGKASISLFIKWWKFACLGNFFSYFAGNNSSPTTVVRAKPVYNTKMLMMINCYFTIICIKPIVLRR